MMSPKNWPTQAELLKAVERANISTDNPGFCLACGEEQDGCEPDARNYKCDACGEEEVFGAEECLLMGTYR